MTTTFCARTRIHAGLGALDGAGQIVTGPGAARVAVVADRGVAEAGLLDQILDRAGIRPQVTSTALIGTNPSPHAAHAAAEEIRSAGADAVLAIGGGSGIGAAKAVALLLTNQVDVTDLEGEDRATAAPVPTVAVPTTAGSGSEVSNALVLHDPALLREVVIRGTGYEPRDAILDAIVLRGLPRAPLVHAALDALTHALEALWSRGRNTFTDACALHAAAGIFDMLPQAVHGCDDGRNRAGGNDLVLQRLLELSSLANLACGNSGLALVHALSSSPAVHLPHGQQNGVLLPWVADLNRATLGDEARRLIDRIPELYERIGFQARFDPARVDADAMIQASRGHAFRTNNARAVSDGELRALLTSAGAPNAVPTP